MFRGAVPDEPMRENSPGQHAGAGTRHELPSMRSAGVRDTSLEKQTGSGLGWHSVLTQRRHLSGGSGAGAWHVQFVFKQLYSGMKTR